MKLEALIKDQKYPIEIKDGANGKARVVLADDPALEVDVRRVEPDVWSLIIDGKSYEATVQPVESGLRVTIRGEIWDIAVYDPRTQGTRQKKITPIEGTQVIASPMPGRVVGINCAIGETVEAGQGVITVEAMKMENELQAEGPGVVKDIKVKPGQAVEEKQVLVVIE